MAERTIAVYYSPIYCAVFVLTYKVRPSVSFFDNLAAEYIDTPRGAGWEIFLIQ